MRLPGTGLPQDTRAQLISIGIWVLREADHIRQGRSASFGSLIDVNTMIRDGLK